MTWCCGPRRRPEGSQAEEGRQPLGAGGGQETILLEPPGGNLRCGSSQSRWGFLPCTVMVAAQCQPGQRPGQPRTCPTSGRPPHSPPNPTHSGAWCSFFPMKMLSPHKTGQGDGCNKTCSSRPSTRSRLMSTHGCSAAPLNKTQLEYVPWCHLISFRRGRGVIRGVDVVGQRQRKRRR